MPSNLRAIATSARRRNRRGERERLRQALLDAASDLLAESPDIERLSVRAITARAGVTAAALYLHFSDKDELARAVRQRCFAELAGAYLRYARENPGHYAIVFHTGGSSQRPASAPSEDVRAAGLAAFELVVQAVIGCGCDPLGAADRAATLWLALHGRAAIQQAMPWFPLPSEDRFIDLLLSDVPGAG